MNRSLHLLCAVFLFGTAAVAESILNPFPVGRIFAEPVGILFPSFNTAAGVNAASMPVNNKGTAINVAVSPTLRSGVDPMRYFGSVASSSRSLGFGAGYTGSSIAGMQSAGAFAGVGYSFDAFALGISVRDHDIKASWDPAVDVGLMLLELKDFTAGAVFYDLNYDTRVDVGIGVKGSRRFQVEANLLLPPFRALDRNYTATVSASISVEPVGFYFRSSYFTGPSDFSHTIGLGAWVSQQVHLAAQFTTVKTASAGLTILL